jgi:ABC-type nitrate/sulfonate/bicarbonate transport system substrate-binding protein
MLVQPRVWLSGQDANRGSGPRLRLSAAHDEWNHVGIALAAIEQGFFAEEGLSDVELVTFPEDSGALLDREAYQVDLIARGVVDVGIDPRTTFLLEAKDQGKPVCIVAARRKNHAFVIIGQKGLMSLEDLRGQSVDMGQRGGATDVMMRQALLDSGILPDTDVKIEYSGAPMHDSAGRAREFIEGGGGPAILAPTAELDNLLGHGFPILADLRERYPSRHDRVTGANENFAIEHPDLLKGFLKGMIRSCRWVLDLDHTEAFKKVIVDAGFLTGDREKRNFDALFIGWQTRGSRDLELPRDGIELIVDEEKRAEQISNSFKVDDVLRLDALRKAQAEVGSA